MSINDYGSENDFQQLQQDISRRRKFGFNSGLGTQAPTGQLPPAGQTQPLPNRQAPNWGGSANYGFSGRSHFPEPTGTGSFSQAWNNSGQNAQSAITSPSSSRAMRRAAKGGISSTATSSGRDSVSGNGRVYNIDFGDENIGNVDTGGGDILGSGAQQDKRTQTAVTQINGGNKSITQEANGGAGGKSGNANGGSGGPGGPGGSATATARGTTPRGPTKKELKHREENPDWNPDTDPIPTDPDTGKPL